MFRALEAPSGYFAGGLLGIIDGSYLSVNLRFLTNLAESKAGGTVVDTAGLSRTAIIWEVEECFFIESLTIIIKT